MMSGTGNGESGVVVEAVEDEGQGGIWEASLDRLVENGKWFGTLTELRGRELGEQHSTRDFTKKKGALDRLKGIARLVDVPGERGLSVYDRVDWACVDER